MSVTCISGDMPPPYTSKPSEVNSTSLIVPLWGGRAFCALNRLVEHVRRDMVLSLDPEARRVSPYQAKQ